MMSFLFIIMQHLLGWLPQWMSAPRVQMVPVRVQSAGRVRADRVAMPLETECPHFQPWREPEVRMFAWVRRICDQIRG